MPHTLYPKAWVVAYAEKQIAGLVSLAVRTSVPEGKYTVFESGQQSGKITLESAAKFGLPIPDPWGEWNNYSEPMEFNVTPASMSSRLAGLVVSAPGECIQRYQGGRFRFYYSCLGDDPEIQNRIARKRRYYTYLKELDPEAMVLGSSGAMENMWDSFIVGCDVESDELAKTRLRTGMFIPIGVHGDDLEGSPMVRVVSQLKEQISETEFLIDLWSLTPIRKMGTFLRASNFLALWYLPEVPDLRPKIEFIPIGELLEISEPVEKS